VPDQKIDPQITPHFRLSEFALPKDKAKEYGFEATPYPQEWVEPRLRPLCKVLEEIREACGGRKVTVISGFRSEAYDAARRAAGHTGVAEHSQHHQGLAADIAVAGVDPEQLRAIVLRLHTTGRIKVGGIGLYPWGVHVDIRQLLQPGARLALW